MFTARDPRLQQHLLDHVTDLARSPNPDHPNNTATPLSPAQPTPNWPPSSSAPAHATAAAAAAAATATLSTSHPVDLEHLTDTTTAPHTRRRRRHSSNRHLLTFHDDAGADLGHGHGHGRRAHLVIGTHRGDETESLLAYSELSHGGDGLLDADGFPLIDSASPDGVGGANVEALRELSEGERFELGALWLQDAVHFRTAFKMTSPLARWSHGVLHSRAFRILRKVVIFVHLALAFVEFPSSSQAPLVATTLVELCCCALYVLELVLAYCIRGRAYFVRNPWKMAKCALVGVTVLDATLCAHALHWRFRPLRALRAYYLVENSRDLRTNFVYFVRILPRVLHALSLLTVAIVVYALLGVLLFGDWHEAGRYDNYFSNFHQAFYRLFTLVTTVNFPDVMLPAFERDAWYFVYFVSYLAISLYFMMNLVLALVLYTYRTFLKIDYELKISKQTRSLLAVFDLLAQHDVIDVQTFLRLFSTAYPGYTREQVVEIFGMLDLDDSGYLQSTEFIDLCTTFRFYHTAKDETIPVDVRERSESARRFPRVYLARRSLRKVVEHRYFRLLVTLVIFVNAVSLVVEASMVEGEGRWTTHYRGFDYAICSFFVIELLVKLAGFGLREFWHASWNRFDVTLALVSIAVEAFTDVRGIIVYRIILIMRVASHVERFESLLDLAGRLLLPFRVNFLSLVAIFYVFAIAGLWFFYGKLDVDRYGDELKDTLYVTDNFVALNFDTFARTLLVLFCMLVVNNWHIFGTGITATCGPWAMLYFIFFYLIAVVIVLNVVVAFFLEIFSAQLDAKGGAVEHVGSVVEFKISNQNKARAFLLGLKAQAERQAHLQALRAVSGTESDGPLSPGASRTSTPANGFYAHRRRNSFLDSPAL